MKHALRARYSSLITAWCRRVNLCDHRAAILADGKILVEGVAMTLTHDEVNEYRAVMLYCDLGELPLGGEEKTKRRLLELNTFMLCGETSGGMALNPRTGRIVFVTKLLLDDLDAESLAAQLKRSAEWAKTWAHLTKSHLFP